MGRVICNEMAIKITTKESPVTRRPVMYLYRGDHRYKEVPAPLLSSLVFVAVGER